MNIFTLSPTAKPKVLILLPENICNKNQVSFLLNKIITVVNFNILDLAFGGLLLPDKGKVKVEFFDTEIQQVIDYCELMGIRTISVGNADYFTLMTGNKKMMLNFGRGIEGIKRLKNYTILPFLNPVILNRFPERKKELHRGLLAIKSCIEGTYQAPVFTLALDLNIILNNPKEIYEQLKEWHNEPELYVDIETTGLRWYEDRLLTMSFARNEKEAFCIAIHEKYHNLPTYEKIKKILKSFFESYKGKLIGHNWIGFDQAFIVHEIMRNGDFLVNQIPIINKFNLEDSMLLAYIMYNSTERVSIGLKELSFPFMGEYDADIDQKNLYDADLNKVGLYNNYDVIATCKIWKSLNNDAEKDTTFNANSVYQKVRNIGISLLKMKMNGLIINRPKVTEKIDIITQEIIDNTKKILEHPIVIEASHIINRKNFDKYNARLVNKKKYEDCLDKFNEPFNPNSVAHKKLLFFDLLGLPEIKTSKITGDASADKGVIAEWLDMDLPEETKNLLNIILEIQTAAKVNNTYLKVFKESSIKTSEGVYKVFANFNQTGTISGRLSSSGGLNFQNLPSNSKYGSLVKELIIPKDGYILGTIDYNALEDRLIAIESNDTNKIRIFNEKIDGHCLNAFAYFEDELKERGIVVDIHNTESINSIKELAGDLRQAGKRITFGINYGAKPPKIASELKITIEEAEIKFNNYWQMYQGVANFNNKVVEQSRNTGYVISDFSGLRLILSSINAIDSSIKAKEERVAANFKIQSGNFLTLEGLHKFQLEIEKNNFEEDVLIYNTVHDSIKFMIKDDNNVIKWVNDTIVKILTTNYKENQSIPLDAELDIGYNEKKVITLPNNIDISDIIQLKKSLEG